MHHGKIIGFIAEIRFVQAMGLGAEYQSIFRAENEHMCDVRMRGQYPVQSFRARFSGTGEVGADVVG